MTTTRPLDSRTVVRSTDQPLAAPPRVLANELA